AIGLLIHAPHAAHVARIDDYVSEPWIDGHPAIVRAALLSGKHDSILGAAVGRERSQVVHAADFFDELAAIFLVLRLAVEHFVGRDAQARQWRRLYWKWLCGPAMFPRYFARWDRTLLHGINRLPGF